MESKKESIIYLTMHKLRNGIKQEKLSILEITILCERQNIVLRGHNELEDENGHNIGNINEFEF